LGSAVKRAWLALVVTTTACASRPSIHLEDVNLFYRVYDAAGGHPTADQLQHDYLDRGSRGLQDLAKIRHVTGARIADNLTKHPEMYETATRCLSVLPRVRRRVKTALHVLGQVYPEARFPPVTIVIGRGKPAAVGSPVTGVQIGLEVICATKWANPNIEDQFVYTIVHEYAHVQQVRALVDDTAPTVLEGTLIEGIAEFMSELTAGSVAYYGQAESVRGRELELETAWVGDEDKKDLSKWLYNSTLETRGDLGYWVGYRIAKSYYQHATDKRQAVRDMLQMTDPKAFLARSGWYPGIVLQ
jgi:hypothetical protein